MNPQQASAARKLMKEIMLLLGDHLKASGRLDLNAFFKANVAAVRDNFIKRKETDGLDSANSAACLDLVFRLANLLVLVVGQSKAGTSTEGLVTALKEVEALTEIAHKRRFWLKDAPRYGPNQLDIDKPATEPKCPPWEAAEEEHQKRLQEACQ